MQPRSSSGVTFWCVRPLAVIMPRVVGLGQAPCSGCLPLDALVDTTGGEWNGGIACSMASGPRGLAPVGTLLRRSRFVHATAHWCRDGVATVPTRVHAARLRLRLTSAGEVIVRSSRCHFAAAAIRAHLDHDSRWFRRPTARWPNLTQTQLGRQGAERMLRRTISGSCHRAAGGVCGATGGGASASADSTATRSA